MLGAAPIVGASDARLNRIAARACRKFASAIFKVWLEGSTCSSNSFNFVSPYSSHHFPRRRVSPGCATFHPSPPFDPSASLKFDVKGAVGLAYLGPTMHPGSSRQSELANPIRSSRLITLLHGPFC